MYKDALEQLRRELECLRDNSRGRGHSGGPHAAELEYCLTRLTNAINAFTQLGFRSIRLHDSHPELLAHVDSLLKHTDEIRELALRARDVLLRPLPDDKEPGFTQ